MAWALRESLLDQRTSGNSPPLGRSSTGKSNTTPPLIAGFHRQSRMDRYYRSPSVTQDICDIDLQCGNNSGGVDWLEDKSGGDVGKNKSDCTEGGYSGSRGSALGASASAPARAAPSLPQSTHIRPRSTRKRKPTHKSVYDL
ncbi:hypothetical protein Zm00014a_014103 [Zea mays]|uniref:Uncharacterized protein n=2 Tax=Zea mays TaxID=4577 RepID=A0A8J8XF08_MAIZE|nr:hypothetical protein ZEAMMB73_Zm00001d011667 [Zea mays]PWZ11117.1 hypothetical protein Zm00014a_014103 [Zea mays]